MKKYMPLNGLRWSRDSGSALCGVPQTVVLGQAGGYHLKAPMGGMQSRLIVKKPHSRFLWSVRHLSRRVLRSGVLIWATKTPQ